MLLQSVHAADCTSNWSYCSEIKAVPGGSVKAANKPRPHMSPSPENETVRATAAQFATTHWSLVLAAGSAESTQARAALEKLCRTYWYPLYAYIRRKGHRPPDAQDLTQAFFARLLERSLVKKADPVRGRFRTFLLTSLKNFLTDEWDKAHAQKRGGGLAVLSLDEPPAESRYQLEPADESSAERIFERRWAMTLLEQALARLEAEHAALGKRRLFDELHVILLGEKPTLTYADVGARLGMTEGAVKVALHRMRRRYRELTRAEIANTVASPGEIDEEIRYLFSVLSG